MCAWDSTYHKCLWMFHCNQRFLIWTGFLLILREVSSSFPLIQTVGWHVKKSQAFYPHVSQGFARYLLGTWVLRNTASRKYRKCIVHTICSRWIQILSCLTPAGGNDPIWVYTTTIIRLWGTQIMNTSFALCLWASNLGQKKESPWR